MIEARWKPILAHVERYPNLFDNKSIQELISLGAKIQINLYSLEEERNTRTKERARYLVKNQLAHFVGSDAHRSNHRPPKYDAGIQFLYKNCDVDYADCISYNNAKKLIL